MRTIIHISADFPDALVAAKTRAVPWLIESAPGFRHVIYSLNRVSWRSGVAAKPFGPDRLAIAYGAPPYGVRLTHHLDQVSELILADMSQRQIQPDLIHAHKFTVEGLIASKLSEETETPFIASIWGDTDRRIFKAKPALRSAFRDIGERSAMLLPVAPWTKDWFADALGLDEQAFQVLPVITAADAVISPALCPEPRLVSVFALDSWKRKGFDIMVQAVAALCAEVPDVTLDIYGRGGPKALLDMDAIIRKEGMEARVRLMPGVDHGEVQTVMNRYAGFVLPSQPETYGMVFVEAILAGLPLLWSKGEGVDGFFDGMDVGYRCNPRSVEDVAHGVGYMLANQARLKQQIGALQQQGAFEMLRRKTIGAQYARLLSSLTGCENQAADAA